MHAKQLIRSLKNKKYRLAPKHTGMYSIIISYDSGISKQHGN